MRHFARTNRDRSSARLFLYGASDWRLVLNGKIPWRTQPVCARLEPSQLKASTIRPGSVSGLTLKRCEIAGPIDHRYPRYVRLFADGFNFTAICQHHCGGQAIRQSGRAGLDRNRGPLRFSIGVKDVTCVAQRCRLRARRRYRAGG